MRGALSNTPRAYPTQYPLSKSSEPVLLHFVKICLHEFLQLCLNGFDGNHRGLARCGDRFPPNDSVLHRLGIMELPLGETSLVHPRRLVNRQIEREAVRFNDKVEVIQVKIALLEFHLALGGEVHANVMLAGVCLGFPFLLGVRRQMVDFPVPSLYIVDRQGTVTTLENLLQNIVFERKEIRARLRFMDQEAEEIAGPGDFTVRRR